LKDPTTDFGLGDLWSLSLPTRQWVALDAGSLPVPPSATQKFGLMLTDPIRRRLLIFTTIPLNQQCKVKSFDLLAEDWDATMDNPGGVLPFGRAHPSVVYDPVQDRVLMFGGTASGGPTNELWQLTLTGRPTWTLLAPSGTPPAGRARAAAVYDSIGNRLVIHGGEGASPGVATETWVCDFSGSPSWQPLNPSGEPPLPLFANETNAFALYDPLRERMVVVAPETLGVRQGAWALSLGASPAWTHLELGGPSPSARIGVAAVYDARRDAAVMFGGRTAGL
jgi:hypothetical protein